MALFIGRRTGILANTIFHYAFIHLGDRRRGAMTTTKVLRNTVPMAALLAGLAGCASKIAAIPPAPDVLLALKELDCRGLETVQYHLGLEIKVWTEVYEQAQAMGFSAALGRAGAAIAAPGTSSQIIGIETARSADRKAESLPSLPHLRMKIGMLKGAEEAGTREWLAKDCANAAEDSLTSN